MDMLETLRLLSEAAGVGGLSEAADTVQTLLRPLVDEVWQDPMGSVCGLRRCPVPGAPTLLLEAHLDEIGLIVTGIDDKGFLRFDACGGIDRRTIQAIPVVVYGKTPCPGVIGTAPPHLAEKEDKLPPLSDLVIDVGLSAEEAREVIRPGDRVAFAARFADLGGGRVTGKALDDRAGCAAVLAALSRLKTEEPAVNVAVCFSVQEELGGFGAAVAGFRMTPDAAIATDVSFALTPDARPEQCGVLGKGAMLGISPVLDHALTARLEQLAQEDAIPIQFEVMGGKTGTDADDLSVAAGGIRTALLSIPLRYMHTPVELVDTADIEAVAALMAAAARKGAAI